VVGFDVGLLGVVLSVAQVGVLAHEGERECLSDVGSGQHHHEAVDADAESSGGWHAVLEGCQERFVDVGAVRVVTGSWRRLCGEAFSLVDGVGELGVRGPDLHAEGDEVPAFG